MTAVVPGFTYRQIPRNFGTEHWDYSLGLILHVATGPADASLYGWFSNPAAQASSHWWAGASGGREQYLDPDEHVSWAQADGNSLYHSVETGGEPSQPLTDAQIDAVAGIYRWGHDHFGWPYRLAEHPGEKGLGWHGMGGTAWGGHPYCPGDLRKAQRAEILRRAQETDTNNQENDMQLSDDFYYTDPNGKVTKTNLGEAINWIIRNQDALNTVVFGKGIPMIGTDEHTDLATEAAWGRQNKIDLLKASGLTDADIQKITDAMANAHIDVDIRVRGLDPATH